MQPLPLLALGSEVRGQRSTAAMSGRDLRAFLQEHRRSAFSFTRSEDELLPQYLARVTPLRSKKFRDVDYEKLLASAREQKAAGNKRLKRVQQLSKRGKESKETALLKKHREVWEMEQAKLLQARRNNQLELESWRADVLLQGSQAMKDIITELTEHESFLFEGRRQFEVDTVEPIWSLRTDLKDWVERSSQAACDGVGSAHEDVLQELESVKQQQRRIQEILQTEHDLLCMELEQYQAKYLHDNTNDVAEVARGIPPEVAVLECPDAELKRSTLNEFQLLDDRFQATLEQWEEQHRSVLSLKDGGWSKEDARRFSHILEQYPSSLPNRRTLYLDRLIRELPHKTRAEIVSHETWHCAVVHYHCRRKLHLKQWAQDRAELQGRVATIFAESRRAVGARELAREEREKQQRVCQELYQKVSRWRLARLEALRVEAELATKARAEEDERRRAEEEKLRGVREQQKRKLESYHTERACQERAQKEEEERRLVEVGGHKKVQARHDKERVQYRKEQHALRLAEQHKAEERVVQEEKEKEERLQMLRETVQVNVPTDPLRVLRNTKASLAKVVAQQEAELELQRPLFSLHGFSDEKITSDHRFKVAAALREAGLHDTTYARSVLAAIAPPLPPRPDQKSSLFK